jgi:preprotein translocase subunit SecE
MAKFNPVQFFNQVKQEGRRITWPSRKETLVSTVMVFGFVIAASIFFLAVDAVLSFSIGKILGFGG